MILPLEKQVSSLESSKRLCELGFPQESLFYYVPIWGPSEISHYEILPHKLYADADERKIPYYSAYTVAELGELLKKRVGMKLPRYDSIGWFFKEYEDTEAEARAKMLIYLKEKGLI